jgi:hypothetical protein
MGSARGILLVGAAMAAIGLGAACAVFTSDIGVAAARSAASGLARSQPSPLRLGSRGPDVRVLQQRLVGLGYLPTGTTDGVYGMRTWHAVVAFQGWQRLHRDGVVGARTRVSLASAARPRSWARLRRALELDLQRQVLLVVARGRTVRVLHISSATPGYLTPRGRFQIYRRERQSWSVPYRVWMTYALYFRGGFAIHGFGVVPAYPASHGCVRMPLSEAPFVYARTLLHTPVLIR